MFQHGIMSEKEVNGEGGSQTHEPSTQGLGAGERQMRAGFNPSTEDSQKQRKWQSHGQESPHSGLELRGTLLLWKVQA